MVNEGDQRVGQSRYKSLREGTEGEAVDQQRSGGRRQDFAGRVEVGLGRGRETPRQCEVAACDAHAIPFGQYPSVIGITAGRQAQIAGDRKGDAHASAPS